MAVTDKSMYLDPSDSTYANLFNSGKIGMLVTGPWDLSGFPNIKYGVQVMPPYPGTSGGHQTITGPDNWVVFNNGAAQVSAAEKFVLWLTAPAQAKSFSLATGDLPIRAVGGQLAPVHQQMNKALPGIGTFIANLANVKQARPQITSTRRSPRSSATWSCPCCSASAAEGRADRRRPAGRPACWPG